MDGLGEIHYKQGSNDNTANVGETRLGSTVSFHDVRYSVEVGGKCCSGKRNKEILSGLSGYFEAGSMNAILGSTGSGKTSLLDCLAGRKDPSGLTGTILIDGKPQPSNFKITSGYVVQDDVVMGTLTIRENFLFSANLRLPKSVTAEEKNQRVDDTIQELGLNHVQHSKVGTEFIRGVSGGERKRTNIGMELIIAPSVLFLDEPTTGLDAHTANSVMKLLHGLSRKGRTIIFSLHQPRYSIYKLFDRLMLMGRGLTMYHGPAMEALDFFESLGYVCEEHNNPPDFFLDVMNAELAPDHTVNNSGTTDETEKPNGNGELVVQYVANNQDLNEKETTSYNLDNIVIKESKGESEDSLIDRRANELSRQYKASTWFSSVQEKLSSIYDGHKNNLSEKKISKMNIEGYGSSLGNQFSVLSRRNILNIIRNPAASIVQVVVVAIFGLIVGLIYRDVGDGRSNGIQIALQNRIGAFFFIVMNQVFGNLSAVEIFIAERRIFLHESSSGFYRVFPYFLSKIFCDIIPMRIIPIIMFTLCCYFLIGLANTVEQFFLFNLSLMFVSIAAASVGFFVSACVRIFTIANLGIALIYVFMMVFGGFLVAVDSIDVWLRWIKYLSIFRYSLNALYINELKDLTLCPVNASLPCDTQAGNNYLRLQGLSYDSPWDFWQNIVALSGISFVLILFSYIALRRMNKYK